MNKNQNWRRILTLICVMAMLVSILVVGSVVAFAADDTASVAEGNVAKVGNTEYATIDEAIANWTNGSTLTLLADVTLSDVVTFKSTEHHILNLGTYTLTAASGKNAIEITCEGRSSASYALTVNADANNPGGITAPGKSCIYYNKTSTTKDRAIILINNGVFTGSYSLNITSKNGNTDCPQVWINGGTFNSYMNLTKCMLKVSGGTFHAAINCTGDTSAYREIKGGKFKSWQFMTADSPTKFWVGSGNGNYNVGAYVDDAGYLVVGGDVVTEAGETFEASSANYSGWSSYLKYSSVATNDLYYTSVEEALADNNKSTGSVTVYVDELDLTGINYKGTIVVPDDSTLTIVNAPAGLKVKNSAGEELAPKANGSYTTVLPTGSVTPAFTGAASIWGEGGGNASESLVVELYSNDTLLASASLNNIGGIIDGDVYVSWNIPLNNAGNDEYWNVVWENYITADLQPTKVVMVIDGVKVAENNYQLNSPDDLNKIYAASADADGKFTKYYTSLSAALAAVTDDAQTTVVLRDVTENLTGASLRGNIVGNATITLTNSDWVYCPYTFVIGEDVTLNVPALFYYAGSAVIKGTVKTGAYYQRYAGTKLYVEGTMTVTSETFIVRYMEGDPNAGIYVDGGTLNASVIYFYQGTISATNGTINVGTYWQTNETDGQGSANLVLDNSTLNVSVYDYPAKATGNSTVTLKNGSTMNCQNGGFTYGANADISVDSNSKIVGKGGEDVELPVAKIGDVKYTSLESAFAAAQAGETIVLLADATPALTSQRAITAAAVIDLNGKTLTLTEDDLYFGTIEFKNGKIVVDSVNASTAVFWMFENQTLTFNGVELVATGVTGTYLIGINGGTGTEVKILNNSKITIENASKAALTAVICDNGNGNSVVIENSIINVNNIDGRVYLGGKNGTITVNNSTLALDGVKEGFYLRAGQSLDIKGNSNVTIVLNSIDGRYGINVTDITATYTKAGTATVDATVFEIVPAAMIGDVKYATLQAAIDAAQADDVVTVLAGTYAVPTLKAGITLVGEGKVVFEGTLTGTLENLTLKNIHIKGGNAQRWAYAKGNLVFENVTFEATSVYALHFDGITEGTNLTYKNCTIIGWAAMSGSPASCVFEGCTFKGNDTYGLIRTYFDATITDCTFDVANVNTTDIYQDGIHAVEGAKVTVTNCTNVNGDMKDVVNVSGTSTVVLDDVVIKNVAKIGDNYYLTVEAAIAAANSGDVITLLADTALTSVVKLENTDITIAGDYTLTLNDKLTVYGETTLNVSAKLAGEVILGHNAILKDSTINGDVFVAGKVIFRGANTVNMLYDYGTLTDYYGTEAAMAWTVEAGASLKILNKARFGLGYGDSVTIFGSIADALTARETLTDGDIAFFVHGLVAQESKGWNQHSYLTVENAYVVIGDNNSFGNKPGNYGGEYTFTFNNVVLDASRITFYEALSKSEFTFTDSDVVIGTFMTNDADSKFTLVNTKLLSTTTTNGNDEGNYHAGTLILTNSYLTYSATVTLKNGSVVKMDLGSCITAPAFVGDGKIIIDATNYTESILVLKGDMSSFTGTIEIVGNNKVEYAITDDGIMIKAKPVAKIGDTYYATLVDAFKAATEGCTIELLMDVTIDGKWDCRDYAANGSHSQFKESVTINGNGHTIKFTGTVSDGNWNTIFRFEENATVKNLTVDISEANGVQRVITAKKSLTVDGLTIIGSAKYGIIFGEGSSATDLAAAEIVITNSTLTGTRRAISDNEGGKDVKSVVITGNTLNANVAVSASESIVFNNNTANGEVDLRSYAADNVLTVKAQGNTLTAGAKNYIYAKNIDAQPEFTAERPAFKVSTKAELDAALAAAQAGDTIILTADIDYGTDQLAITKAITLDLGGKTLTTRFASGGMSVKGNPTIKNGTIVHESNTAAIKVWNATAFEDLVIEVKGKGDANKTIGGIVLQSGSTTRVGSIKNVTIKGAALTNGIETYNCGDATENVIGSMENVTITAQGTGMLISAPCGTATNCTISGGVNGIEIWIKGNYSASLDLANSTVNGGVYAHDEFNNNPGVVNNGTLSLTVSGTTNVGADDITLTLARAENVAGLVKDVKDNAQAKVNDTYYATIAAAIKAAKSGDVVTILAGNYTVDISVNSGVILVGETDAQGNNLVNITGRVSATTGATVKNLNIHNEKTGDYDCALNVNGANIVIDGVKLTGYNGMRYCYANGDITIKNSTINASNFAVHFDGKAGGNVQFVNCDITGWCSYAGTISAVSYTDCELDQGNYAGHRYYNKNISFTNCDFADGFKIELTSNNTNVAFTDSDMTMSDVKALFKDPYRVLNGNVTLNGEKATYVASANGKYYDDLQECINDLPESTSTYWVYLRSDVVLENTLTIPAGKKLAINLNGKTISGTHGSEYSMIHVLNGAELTIEGNGTISYAAGGDKTGAAIWVEGKLTLDGGIIELTGAWSFGFAVDVRPNAWGTAHTTGASFVMNGGTVKSTDTAVRVASNSSDAYDELGVTFTMNGGSIVSDWDAIFVQHLYNGDLDINVLGGTVSGANSAMRIYGNAGSDIDMIVSGGNFTGVIKVADAYANTDAIAISGGIFNAPVAEAYCADGYIPTKNSDGTYGVKEGAFVVRNTTTGVGYESLVDALEAAQAGDEIALLADVEATEVILIDKSLTINGNGHKVTSSATRVFRVTASNVEVTLNGVNMVNTKASSYIADIRGISIDAGLTNVKLTLNNCSVDFTDASACDWAYAVNVSGNGTGHTLTINGGSYEGANVINVHGANNTVVVKDATLNCTYPNSDLYAGACIWVLQNQGSSVEATGNTFNGANAIAFNLGTGTALTESNNTDNTTVVVAKIGDTYYTSLADAFAAAQNGDTITLLADIALDASVTNTKKVTLDLNGKTITGTDNATGSFGLINNKGTLTITGNGTITLVATNDRDWNAYSSVISNQPGGKLVVENGTIEHLGGTDMAYAIDNLTNGKGTYAETVINGGTIKSTYRAVRQFLNGVEAQNILTVNGGTIEGDNKAIWMQDPSKNANTGKLTVGENAVINGDIYLSVTAGSTEWPVEVSIAASAVNGEVLTGNVPSGYVVENVNGSYTINKYLIMVTYPVGNPVYPEGKVEYYNDMLQAVPYTTNCPRLEGATITLLGDVSAAGMRFMENDMIFDLNGFTFTITAGTGSQGTNTSGFQIRPEVTTNVIFKNGTIKVAEGAPVVWMFNCYATDFIVENVTVDCTNMAWSYGNSCYVVVSRSGDNVQFLGTTKVVNFNSEVAGLAYSVGGTMTVADTVVLGGDIELDVGATLTAPAGLNVYTDNGYGVVYNNGIYSVIKYVAELNGVKYDSFDAAYKAAKTGDTIKLLDTVVITKTKAWINYSTKKITIDATDVDVAFRVEDGANVWFGSMTVNTNGTAIVVDEDANVDFYGGTYNATTVIEVESGRVNVMAGSYTGAIEAEKSGVSVQGGKFTVDPTNYLVAGYAVSENSDGTFGVVDAVAKIGNTYYATLQAAINAGGEVVLLKNVTITETIKVLAGNTVTLDLNGKTIDGIGNVRIAIMSYGNLTIKDSASNGVIKAGIDTAGNAINICAGTFTLESGSIYSLNNALLIDEEAATININGGKITAEPNTRNSAAFYISSTSNTVVNITDGEIVGYNGILLWNNTTVNVTGGTITATGSTGIQGNGSKDNTEINISNGEISGYWAAIYHPQGGKLNISGGTLTGYTGVVVKGGIVNISGGTIKGTGAADTYRPVSSGYVDTGDALYVEHYDNSTNSENYGTPVVTVTGGTFISANAKAVASYVNPNNNIEALKGFISGGTFSSDVSELCKQGFKTEENTDGTYGVVAYYLSGEGTEANPYMIYTVEDLIFFRDSVNAGETTYNAEGVYVALGADLDLAGIDWSVNIGDDCNATFDGIFDGKGHTIKNLTSTETAQKGDVYICTGLFGAIYGNAVIKNLTISGATINVGNYTGSNVGVVVGFAYSATGSIENVKVVNATINAPEAYAVGAIVGYVYYGDLNIDECVVDGATIVASSEAGAIVGYGAGSNITNSTVKGVTITADGLVGGIAGLLFGDAVVDTATISNVTLTVTESNWIYSSAIVVGTLAGDGTTISGITYENVTGATRIAGSAYVEHPTTTVPAVQAMVGNKYYTTYEAAYAAVEAGVGDKAVLLTAVRGAALKLDSDIGIYYYIDKTSIVGEGYVAVIKNAAGETVAEINFSEWKYDATKKAYLILYDGLAAKQMTEEFTIEITSLDGTVFNSATTSVKTYVERGLAANIFNDADKALLTALLNYGAQVENYFGKTDSDANGNIELPGITDKPETNNLSTNPGAVGDSFYSASSINAEHNVQFNFKFKAVGLGDVAKAVITYAGKEVTIDFNDFYLDSNRRYVITLTDIDISYYKDAITCTLYDASGNALATATDSIWNYCTRAINGNNDKYETTKDQKYLNNVYLYSSIIAYGEAVVEYNK